MPPYSLNLNLIEQLFAKPGGLLRKAAARTVGTLCAGYFRHAGYGST
ncbi:MAG: hypothetical protein OXE40_07545 [Gammaproteobacteria bacterium]|nr:hypothetical protein [Gammaproteobacteria bacterium]